MTTTKKKAKDVTLRDRVSLLETDLLALMDRVNSIRQRHAMAIEKAESSLTELYVTATKTRAEVAGVVSRLTALACDAELVRLGWTLEGPAPVAAAPETEKPAPPPAHPWATPQPIATAPLGEILLPPPPDDPAWQDARLRDAVVEAALAWSDYAQCGTEMGEAVLRRVAFTGAVDALRAHRAKKGGAS